MRPPQETTFSRRRFLTVAAATAALGAPLRGAQYDLVIRGGRVIDPAQGLDRILDVAVSAGQIAALERNIPPADAVETIDARGKLVVPGLIDVHLHARDAELPPKEILSTGVTTMVDGGSRGADNVEQLLGIARSAPNRMRILLNIGRLGNNPNGQGEFLDGLEQADVDKARAAIERNRHWIIGIKARLSRGVAAERDLDVLRRAVQAATPLNVPIMVHMGDTVSPLPEILAVLRPGDILTHLYAPTGYGIMDERGRVLPEVREARRRGILFDLGHGLNDHWTWEMAQSGLKQDFPPDTLSSDLNLAGRTDQVFDLPNVISKFLLLGMPLREAIACVTSNAARMYRELNPYGSLRPGSAGDVTVLELASGQFEFLDNQRRVRTGTQKLFTRAVVAGGKRVA